MLSYASEYLAISAFKKKLLSLNDSEKIALINAFNYINSEYKSNWLLNIICNKNFKNEFSIYDALAYIYLNDLISKNKIFMAVRETNSYANKNSNDNINKNIILSSDINFNDISVDKNSKYSDGLAVINDEKLNFRKLLITDENYLTNSNLELINSSKLPKKTFQIEIGTTSLTKFVINLLTGYNIIRLPYINKNICKAYPKGLIVLFILKKEDVNVSNTHKITSENIDEMLSLPDLNSVKGKRDYAIVRLLWDCALRRSEIASLNIEDFNSKEGTLKIKGKGRVSKETIYLSDKTIDAIEAWLSVRYQPLNCSLFISLDNATNGHRLSDKSVYRLVKKYSSEIPSGKVLSPHQIRHSSITALLEATNGNVRLAQKFSRHSNLNTLMIYDDNRVALQQEAVNILSSLA